MSDSQLIWSALVAVGVVIVVIGLVSSSLATISRRWHKREAENKDRQCFTTGVGSPPSDASPEEISRTYNDRYGSPYRTNPYAGGEHKMLAGLAVALIGGVVAYYGAH